MIEMTKVELDEAVAQARESVALEHSRINRREEKLARAVLHLAEQVRRDTATIIEEEERCAAKLAEAHARTPCELTAIEQCIRRARVALAQQILHIVDAELAVAQRHIGQARAVQHTHQLDIRAVVIAGRPAETQS